MEQTEYNGIPVIYYDINDDLTFEELDLTYKRLVKKLPNLIMLPNTLKIVTTDVNEIRAIRDYLNQVIEDLENYTDEQA